MAAKAEYTNLSVEKTIFIQLGSTLNQACTVTNIATGPHLLQIPHMMVMGPKKYLLKELRSEFKQELSTSHQLRQRHCLVVTFISHCSGITT